MNLWQRIFGPKNPLEEPELLPNPAWFAKQKREYEFNPFQLDEQVRMYGLAQSMPQEEILKRMAGAQQRTPGDWLRALAGQGDILKGKSPMHGKNALEQIQVHIANLKEEQLRWRTKQSEACTHIAGIESTISLLYSISYTIGEEAKQAEKTVPKDQVSKESV